ncbi:hypothetical protein [Yersinia wautersii]|uniref:hypothetical protein n=1 Tax=Yersinia wautersii TaxID=1341643 RepID=UPI0004064E54|nr:hypothetical protein [Yersinia wautersii]
MNNQKSMPFPQLEAICECLYGRSWKSQLADFLVIDRRRVNDWEKSGIVPAFVSNEIAELIARRKKELNYIDMLAGKNFSHAKAILDGKTLHLDESLNYTKEMVLEFVSNQRWAVKQLAKYRKTHGDSRDEVIAFVEDIMLGEDDFASWIENNDVKTTLELVDIENIRAGHVIDVIQYVEHVLFSA